MKKTLLLLIILLGSGFWYFNQQKNVTDEGRAIVKIGATLPLTGDGSEAGQVTKEALQLMLEHLEQRGLKYDYQLIFEDNQMNPKMTATTTNKLIGSDKVKAVLSFWGVMSNVVSAIADKNQVISMSCAFGENATNGKYNFNFMPTYESQAEVLVNELKKRNVKNLAAFIDNSDMLHQYEAIEKEIKDNSDINIVFFEKFNIGEKDYKMAISKANARKPDMYLISGYNPSVYLFLKQLKEITGRNDNVTSVDVFTEISPENMYMADGLWYVDSQLMGSKEFQKRLKEEAVLTSQSCTGNTVSNLEILVDAFENAKVDEGDVLPSKDNVREYIFANTHNKNTASGEANIINDGLIVVEPRIEVIDASWFLSGGRR